MRITNIDALSLDLPLKDSEARAYYAGRVRSTVPMLLVRVRTNEGLTGWGEAFAFNLRSATRAALKDEILPRLIGKDLAFIAPVMEQICRDLRNSKAGPLTYAVSAIDLALWDIAAKAAGVPLYYMFGGAIRHRVSTYASLVRIDNPVLAAERSAKALEDGHRAVKLHELGWESCAAVREAVGDVTPLMFDVSSAWSVNQAVVMAHRLKSLAPLWIEEPTWPPEDTKALARVAEASGVPIAAGENASSATDLRVLCETAGISYAQPSLPKIGGVSQMLKATAIAEAFNVAVAPHCYYLGPALFATLHLGAASTTDILVEHAVFDLEETPYGGLPTLQDGMLSVPQTSGVGPEPDSDFIRRYLVDD